MILSVARCVAWEGADWKSADLEQGPYSIRVILAEEFTDKVARKALEFRSERSKMNKTKTHHLPIEPANSGGFPKLLVSLRWSNTCFYNLFRLTSWFPVKYTCLPDKTLMKDAMGKKLVINQFVCVQLDYSLES